MNTVRFIALPHQASRLNEYLETGRCSRSLKDFKEGEIPSVVTFKKFCKEYGISFQVIGIDEFINLKPDDGVSLLLDVDIEPIVYSKYWSPPLKVDGQKISKLISDKYTIYRIVQNIPGVLQPKTAYIKNHLDIPKALSHITTPKIVLKPRSNSYSSHNVLILNRERIEHTSNYEMLNFTEYLLQEYLEETLWPPQEWRFHFIGRDICRCMKICDKNNWKRSLHIQDLPVQDVPQDLVNQAIEIAKRLANSKSKDNFTLDFLETKTGFLFLEANCGALGSFYIQKEEDEELLRPIIRKLLKVYFRMKTA